MHVIQLYESISAQVQICAHIVKNMFAVDTTLGNVYLLFEFFKCEQPHQCRLKQPVSGMKLQDCER